MDPQQKSDTGTPGTAPVGAGRKLIGTLLLFPMSVVFTPVSGVFLALYRLEEDPPAARRAMAASLTGAALIIGLFAYLFTPLPPQSKDEEEPFEGYYQEFTAP